MDVKLWEPQVWSWFVPGDDEPSLVSFDADTNPICQFMDYECNKPNPWSALVTLTNGQRIIVRALSEDRKAARAAMKEANQ